MVLVLVPLLASCGGSNYQLFSLREGIGHFSMEYPPGYTVTRIDIRNSLAERYSDVGLRDEAMGNAGLREISVYIWPAGPAEDTAVGVLEGMLAQAGGVFPDFKVLDGYSVMIGDMEGQAAVFSWTASAGASGTIPMPAISNMVCFRHGDLAWEIHVASDTAASEWGETEFQHILETFRILN